MEDEWGKREIPSAGGCESAQCQPVNQRSSECGGTGTSASSSRNAAEASLSRPVSDPALTLLPGEVSRRLPSRSSAYYPPGLLRRVSPAQDQMRQEDPLPVVSAPGVRLSLPERSAPAFSTWSVSLSPLPGSLSTGQGTRFVLAATEHLHQRIASLNSRVRQLEDALAGLQAKLSSEPHPLLSDDLVAANCDDDPVPMLEDPAALPAQTEVIDALGTLSISDHGISRFFGPTGGSEVRPPFFIFFRIPPLTRSHRQSLLIVSIHLLRMSPSMLIFSHPGPNQPRYPSCFSPHRSPFSRPAARTRSLFPILPLHSHGPTS